MELSNRRAEAAAKYLIDKSIAPDRMESAGFGGRKPRHLTLQEMAEIILMVDGLIGVPKSGLK